jgi:hypothetical protein
MTFLFAFLDCWYLLLLLLFLLTEDLEVFSFLLSSPSMAEVSVVCFFRRTGFQSPLSWWPRAPDLMLVSLSMPPMSSHFSLTRGFGVCEAHVCNLRQKQYTSTDGGEDVEHRRHGSSPGPACIPTSRPELVLTSQLWLTLS